MSVLSQAKAKAIYLLDKNSIHKGNLRRSYRLRRQIDHLRASLTPSKKIKVFGIGYNKTGTTTLESLFKNKYKHKVPNQFFQEYKLGIDAIYHKNYSNLRAFCSIYDFFQDSPFSMGNTYLIADFLFPESKFILTIRESEDWYKSLVRFHMKHHFSKMKLENIHEVQEEHIQGRNLGIRENYYYFIALQQCLTVKNHLASPNWTLLFDKEFCINHYSRRNEDIIKHFSTRPDKLLVIDLAKETDDSKIINFLGLNFTPSRLPHLNKT